MQATKPALRPAQNPTRQNALQHGLASAHPRLGPAERSRLYRLTRMWKGLLSWQDRNQEDLPLLREAAYCLVLWERAVDLPKTLPLEQGPEAAARAARLRDRYAPRWFKRFLDTLREFERRIYNRAFRLPLDTPSPNNGPPPSS